MEEAEKMPVVILSLKIYLVDSREETTGGQDNE